MKTMGTSEIWAGPLSDGSKAVVLLNRGSSSVDLMAEWSDIGWDSNEVTVSPMNIGTKLTTIMHLIIIIVSMHL